MLTFFKLEQDEKKFFNKFKKLFEKNSKQFTGTDNCLCTMLDPYKNGSGEVIVKFLLAYCIIDVPYRLFELKDQLKVQMPEFNITAVNDEYYLLDVKGMAVPNEICGDS